MLRNAHAGDSLGWSPPTAAEVSHGAHPATTLQEPALSRPAAGPEQPTIGRPAVGPAGPERSRGEGREVPLVSVGMILFLGSELMFFAALFAAYFTMRARASAWPPRGTELDVLQPAIFTAVLVLSSGTMQLAVARIREDDRAGARRWLWVTAGLGALFLVGQYLDYRGRNFGISTSAYGSAFYTMTGFHALHVLAGLILLLVAQARAGAYSAADHGGLEAIGYYWHFVDVVWLALFAAIFLVR